MFGKERSNNKELGGDSKNIQRVRGMLYRGDEVRVPGMTPVCTLIATPKEVAMEKGDKILHRVPMTDVYDAVVQERPNGKGLLIVNTKDGTLPFEFQKSVLQRNQLESVLTMIQLNGRGKQVEPTVPYGVPPGGVVYVPTPVPSGTTQDIADQIRKMDMLRYEGSLTDEEFETFKRRLLGN